MTAKADFNAEEWATLTEAPALAGLWVVASSKHGTIRESMAIAKVYAAVQKTADPHPLLDDLTAHPPSVDKQEAQASGGDVKAYASGKIKEAVALLQSKATPEELDVYRNFVLDIAEAAAKAHKEGGFIGIGGTQVSEAEQAAIDEITALLGE